MRKSVFPLFCLALSCLFMSACDWGSSVEPVGQGSSTYSPVLMKRSDLEQSVKVMDAKALMNPGKIYHYNQYILITEKYEGIHILDNSDPKNPVNKSFIAIPGCVDLAVKNQVLYADNAVDLISLSIADLNDIQVLSRKANVFPELLPPDYITMPSKYSAENRPENTIIIAWK